MATTSAATDGWNASTAPAGSATGQGTDGLSGGYGQAGVGLFYRNSHNRIANVTDGLSNTIFVGEHSGNHSPSTWTGAVTGGRCPAWMATQPSTPLLSVPRARLQQCRLRRGLCPLPRQRHARALCRLPDLRPRHVLQYAHGQGANFLFGDGSVHFLNSGIDPNTYQHLCTIAGGEAPVIGERPVSTKEFRHASRENVWSCRFVLAACCGCGRKSTDQLVQDLKAPRSADQIIAVRLLPQRKGDAAKVIPALIEALGTSRTASAGAPRSGLGRLGNRPRTRSPRSRLRGATPTSGSTKPSASPCIALIRPGSPTRANRRRAGTMTARRPTSGVGRLASEPYPRLQRGKEFRFAVIWFKKK